MIFFKKIFSLNFFSCTIVNFLLFVYCKISTFLFSLCHKVVRLRKCKCVCVWQQKWFMFFEDCNYHLNHNGGTFWPLACLHFKRSRFLLCVYFPVFFISVCLSRFQSTWLVFLFFCLFPLCCCYLIWRSSFKQFLFLIFPFLSVHLSFYVSLFISTWSSCQRNKERLDAKRKKIFIPLITNFILETNRWGT